MNHKVETITEKDSYYIIDDLLQSRGIIIATGAGAFKPKAFPLPVPETLQSKVNYFIKNPATFAGKNVAVLGGGDSALDLAIELSKVANVTLIHRRNEFRGLESNVEKVKTNPKIQLLTPYLPHSVSDKNGKFELSLKKVGTELIDQAEFDNLLVAYGFRANNRFVKKWGIQTSDGLIEVDRKMQTSKERIFAVGDCVTYAGRVPVIGIGFGEAQLAISNIMQSLFPEKKITIHSTSI
ncbi:thioredoxin reductase [Lactobacillus psittaci DSM 15354]|uniref:Thioredoxin reductase n=1 Tax=Lactobacillus psittaci DSM 15354 TaxID=1122152 RepID=A0A0R1S693_9LACO|nr:thioredoxin reductase [Lactobacillus psittaci DSM 15354]